MAGLFSICFLLVSHWAVIACGSAESSGSAQCPSPARAWVVEILGILSAAAEANKKAPQVISLY